MFFFNYIAKKSIPINDETQEQVYFDIYECEKNYSDYFSKLSTYTKEYELSFRFYDIETNEIVNEKCTGFEVKITAKPTLFTNYERTLFNEIRL